MLTTLDLALNLISLIQSDAYRWQINKQNQRKLQTVKEIRI